MGAALFSPDGSVGTPAKAATSQHRSSIQVRAAITLMGVVVLTACGAPKHPVIVHLLRCDTIPKVVAGSRSPRLPPAPAVDRGLGAIIGTIEELGTGAAVGGGGRVRLRGDQDRFTGTDTMGGFAIDRVAPGRYLLSFAHAGYDVTNDSVVVVGRTIDTLHLRLQYRVCP
jgi:hypothetical protein